MKLQEVPTEILTESLLALADLKRKYRGREQKYRVDGIFNCPLCRMALHHNPHAALYNGEGCELCPWSFVEGRQDNFYRCKAPGADYEDQPISDRLARIARWEAAIKDELSTRSKANEQP